VIQSSATVNTAQGTLKNLRLVHGALLLATGLYAVLMCVIAASPGDRPDQTFVTMLGGLSVAVIAAGFAVRKKMIQPALEALRTKPDDIALLGRWRSGAILSATLAEAVVLFGVVIHLLGGSAVQAAGFWIAGALTMLIWWPQAP
jgi:hypothetical protein